MEINWTSESELFMASSGHVLCSGGPGSGKTTLALLKAEREISFNALKSGQRILFLSFARATIARVEERAEKILKSESKNELEINTYHGFAWSVLRSHGYLLTEKVPIKLISPPQSAARLSAIREEEEKIKEKERLFIEEGRLDFDLFAPKVTTLLSKSPSVRKLVSSIYPIVILDEFQDTNSAEWEFIQLLGVDSNLIALADPDQRIYDFRGANPERISQFIQIFSPEQYDFSTTNYRSSSTDICSFGNDLLKRINKTKPYTHVTVLRYPARRGERSFLCLKLQVYKRIVEIKKTNDNNWSLAILVPTKHLMLEVSDYLGRSQTFRNGRSLPSIENDAALDADGPALAAGIIAGVLAGGVTQKVIVQRLIANLSIHIKGRKGAKGPNKQELALTDALDKFLKTDCIRGSKRTDLVDECRSLAETRSRLKMIGNPDIDWLTIRKFFENANSKQLHDVASDARFLRLLKRGSQMRSKLAEIWRSTGSYHGASEAVDTALVREHFSASKQSYRGVHVMTIHKSKGKQFTEVIIYEGLHRGRIVRENASTYEEQQALLSLRVGVTRAEQFATILTPKQKPCPFL